MRCDLNSKKQAICHCQEKKTCTPSLCCCSWGAPTHKPTPRSLALGLKQSFGLDLQRRSCGGRSRELCGLRAFYRPQPPLPWRAMPMGSCPPYLMGRALHTISEVVRVGPVSWLWGSLRVYRPPSRLCLGNQARPGLLRNWASLCSLPHPLEASVSWSYHNFKISWLMPSLDFKKELIQVV